jgi:pentatricopeptide repeat protein
VPRSPLRAALSPGGYLTRSAAAPPSRGDAQELVALGRGPRWREALARFEALRAHGPAPNVHVTTTVIAIAARHGRADFAAAAHAYLRASRLAPSAHTYTALARARGGAGDWRGALALLDEMDAAGVAPTAHTAAALLAACARGGAEGAAAAAPLFRRVAAEVPASQVDPHLVATCLALFGRLGDARGAQRVWAWAAAAGVPPDAHSHSALLAALLRGGDAASAARHFRQLRPRPRSPHVYAAGMRALAAAGAPAAEAVAAFAAMRAAGVAATPHCYAALLASHSRDGDADAALALLATMRSDGVAAPTAVCIHLAMAACAKAGRVADARALLATLRAGPPPLRADCVSYSTAILAAAVAGLPAEAEALFEEMVADSIAPNDYTFSALISAHAAAARAAAAQPGGAAAAAAALRSALGCRSRMAAAGVVESVHTWNACIEAADGAREWGRALLLHAAMRRAGVEPNAATRALMAAVGQRGADDVAAAQSRLAAVSAAAAGLAAALIQKGWL